MLIAWAGGFGLLIGSFLNVVIHRLPLMLERAGVGDYVLERLKLEARRRQLEVQRVEGAERRRKRFRCARQT